MSEPPRKPRGKPREIKRATDAKPERVASRIITARRDLRQVAISTWPRHGLRPRFPPS